MEKKKSELLKEISALTLEIETNYKELYRSLDENPMCIPNMAHPHIDEKALMEYRDSLRQELSHYVEVHKNYQLSKDSKMGEIARSERQITLYCIPDSVRAKETLAYAMSSGLRVQEIDFTRSPLTGTQIHELADALGMHVSDLVNQNHPAYTERYGPEDLSAQDWVKLIRHTPQIMKQPIALHGDKTMLIETPTDILKI